jgi:hypothetical protein
MLGTSLSSDRMLYCAICAMVAIAAAVGLISVLG